MAQNSDARILEKVLDLSGRLCWYQVVQHAPLAGIVGKVLGEHLLLFFGPNRAGATRLLLSRLLFFVIFSIVVVSTIVTFTFAFAITSITAIVMSVDLHRRFSFGSFWKGLRQLIGSVGFVPAKQLAWVWQTRAFL